MLKVKVRRNSLTRAQKHIICIINKFISYHLALGFLRSWSNDASWIRADSLDHMLDATYCNISSSANNDDGNENESSIGYAEENAEENVETTVGEIAGGEVPQQSPHTALEVPQQPPHTALEATQHDSRGSDSRGSDRGSAAGASEMWTQISVRTVINKHALNLFFTMPMYPLAGTGEVTLHSVLFHMHAITNSVLTQF